MNQLRRKIIPECFRIQSCDVTDEPNEVGKIFIE